MKQPKHPRLTPLKAFALLRDLDFGRHDLPPYGPTAAAYDRVRDALASHVRAALTKAGRR